MKNPKTDAIIAALFCEPHACRPDSLYISYSGRLVAAYSARQDALSLQRRLKEAGVPAEVRSIPKGWEVDTDIQG